MKKIRAIIEIDVPDRDEIRNIDLVKIIRKKLPYHLEIEYPTNTKRKRVALHVKDFDRVLPYLGRNPVRAIPNKKLPIGKYFKIVKQCHEAEAVADAMTHLMT